MLRGQTQQKPIGIFGQTLLLFKKNLKSKIRQEPKKLIGEILVPILYLGILSYLVTIPTIATYGSVKRGLGNPPDVLSSFTPTNATIIHVVPDTEDVKNFTNVMNSVLKKGNLTFTFYASDTLLIEEYKKGNVDWAIVFSIRDGMVDFNNYAIRINPDKVENNLPPIATKKVALDTCRSLATNYLEYSSTCPVNGYYYSNFLAIQSLVDQAFLQVKSGRVVELKVDIDGYPKEEYNAGLPIFIRILLPLYSVILLAPFLNNLLVLIVTEKEHKIKDGLRMIGVSDLAYWMSWFWVYSLIILFFSLIFTIVMYLMILPNFNPLILFLLFFLFGCTVITLAFAITPFFDKPKTAGIVGSLVLQVSSLLFMLQTFLEDSSKIALIPLRLISSLAFTTGLDEATANEYIGGIGWSDLTFGGRGGGILLSLIFLVFDLFLYILLAMYLDNVIPNQFGVRKHPLFCFIPSYWSRRAKRNRHNSTITSRIIPENGITDQENWVEGGDDIETISPNLVGKEAIRVRHLTKIYQPSWMQRKVTAVHAVKDVSLNIYEGQITAILGRNGAGKSTLFNMLIGLVSPTSGDSNVFGYDITDSYDMSQLRKMTGVCLQHDLHFDSLTVQEHLEFYGRIRGLDKSSLDSQINTILTDLRLKEKRNTRASKLSGGQKRKLSVGIALIGDPKIILLDEPSAGVDPVSRRHLWDLLQQNKNGKVILLTTHFMDEADILADRKVIIHDGEVKCIGSSLFLKNRFGVGYYLTVELNEREPSTTECDTLIEKWIPSALDSKKVISNEVKYSLPHSEISKFSELFTSLEDPDEKNKAGIKSYGVSMTTLEEVFLKISTNADTVQTNSNISTDQSSNYGSSDEQNLILSDFGEISIKSSSILWAMCKLRIFRLIRSPQAMFFMIVFPVILAGVGLYLVKNSGAQNITDGLILSNAEDVYSNSELHVALQQSSTNTGKLKSFLKAKGFTIHDFDGNFASLLSINQPSGTMAGIKVNKENVDNGSLDILLMINGTFVHSTPIVTALIRQYFESQLLNKTSDLRLTSHPFISKSASLFDATSFYVIFLLGPAFVFTTVGMVMEIVCDREIRVRNHLRVNGLTFKMYYFSIFIVFGSLAVLVTLMQLSLIAIFNVDAFLNPYAFVVTLVLLLLYIPPSLFFSAAFSYLFERMESAQSVFSQVASWGGTIAGLAIVILDATGTQESVLVLIHSIFCAVNIFYVPFGIFYFVNKQYSSCSYVGTCDSLNFSNYTGSEFSVILIVLLIQIPVFFLLLVVADVLKDGGSIKETIRSLFGCKQETVMELHPRSDSAYSLNRTNSLENDQDVLNESIRVNNYFAHPNSNDSCVLAVQSVVKSYPSKIGHGKEKKKVIKNVVNCLSVMLEEGEVFGLLGHNGAGKTTAMKLITAEENPNKGNVKLCGYDIKSNMSKAFIHLGYCAQFDALWENITLREHLEIYSAIRGITPANRGRLVNHFLLGLKIYEHAEKRASNLSGGTKRKLSYAMSMLGSPRVVLLDEPSTGMDPQSKRFLWNTVLGTFKESRGAMLTTHSMEEADALCTRIGIMVKGSLLCIGSPQHLKSKFGAGYTLEVKLKTKTDLNKSLENGYSSTGNSENQSAFAFVTENFPECHLAESFGNRATFSIPSSSIQSISKTFSLLEQMKIEEEIEEYSFSQTTLEQVFLGFAKQNEDNEDE